MNQDFLAVLPILILMVSGSVQILLRGAQQTQWIVSVSGMIGALAASVVQLITVLNGDPLVLQAGGWEMPFGISIYVDTMAALLNFVSIFLTLGILFFVIGQERLPTANAAAVDSKQWEGLLHPLIHWLMVGVCGAYSTGDLFNLYVWFEVMLLSSFVLMAKGSADPKARWGYALMNIAGSAIFLMGLGLLYSSTGTLNFVQLRQLATQSGVMAPIAGVCFAVAFGMKSAAVPMFQWLPLTYPRLSIGLLGLFSGLLTKVGVYTLLRFFSGTPAYLPDGFSSVMLVVASVTMLVGVLGAANRMTMREILGFHIVSQIGYMLVGVALGSNVGLGVTGLAGGVFYLLHHMIVKTNLFLIAGLVEAHVGSSNLSKARGLLKPLPWLGLLFVVPALSLAGLPPLSGFWAKLFVLAPLVSAEAWGTLTIGLVVSILTFYSMMKIWTNVFLGPVPEGLGVTRLVGASRWLMISPVAVFAAWTIFIGVYPKLLAEFSESAGAQALSYLMSESEAAR